MIVEPLVQVPFLDFEAFMFFAVRQDELESHLLLRDVFFLFLHFTTKISNSSDIDFGCTEIT